MIYIITHEMSCLRNFCCQKWICLVILSQSAVHSFATQLQKIPYHFYFLLLLLQTFQRIQRNRQSRIRVKLSRRAGKRSDEILEEDEPNGIHHHVMHLGAHHKMEQPQSSSTPGNYLPTMYLLYRFLVLEFRSSILLAWSAAILTFREVVRKLDNLTFCKVFT